MELKYGSSLQQGRYIIEKVLGQGGFGITYLACQTGLNRKVAVKEFFMQEYCNRDAGTSMVSVPSMGSRELVERYRQKFLKEARLIASFDNNNIIRIYDVFEDNGTAYYVMEYLEGKNLKAVLEECGPLPEDLALKYIRQISLALAEVHASNLLHLDVKPANIMLNKKGEAVLIDFGISKHYDEGGKQTSSALAGTSEGYAPLEQYEAGALDSFTPATDIYALGATLFCLLAGMRPPKASEVMNHGLPELPQDISPAVREAVTAAMQPMVRMRPQSVEEFLELLNSKDLRDPKAFKDLSEETKAPEEELIDDVDVEVTVVPEYREQSIENRVQSAKAKTIEVENEETLAVEKKIEQPTIKNNEPIAPKNNRTALLAATVVLLSGVIGYFLAQGGYDDSKSPRKETLQEAADGVAEPDAPTLQSIANGVPASALQGTVANPADSEIPVEGHSAGKPVKPNEQGAGQCASDNNPQEPNEVVDVIEIVEDEADEIGYNQLVPNEDVSEYADYTDTEIIVAEEEVEEDVVFQVVDQQPEFPGGLQALYKYLADNINYPRVSRENGSQGRVFIRFVVNTDGSIQDAEVIRSSGDVYLDREAVRLVSSMPKWSPGMQAGKAVRVYFTVPVLFKLQ